MLCSWMALNGEENMIIKEYNFLRNVTLKMTREAKLNNIKNNYVENNKHSHNKLTKLFDIKYELLENCRDNSVTSLTCNA